MSYIPDHMPDPPDFQDREGAELVQDTHSGALFVRQPAASGSQKTEDRYSGLDPETFNQRLKAKLDHTPVPVLVSWLLEFAYDAMVEEFNNEILDEWEKYQR